MAINTATPGDVVLGGNTATTDMAGVVFAVPDVSIFVFFRNTISFLMLRNVDIKRCIIYLSF